MTQQWVLHPQAQEYVVEIPIQIKDLLGWADCGDRFIRVVKQTNMKHIVPVGGTVGPAHLVRENAASGGINCVGLEYNIVDLHTYWTVY